MQRFPLYSERRRIVLDGSWPFAWLGEEATDRIVPGGVACDDIAAVPGCFDTAGELIGLRGVALYRREVDYPPGPARLTIGALGLYARVFFDGREVGVCRTPYTTARYDFTVEGDGPHVVEILVDNRFGDDGHTPLFKPFYDFYGYGGIYRSVTLERIPRLALGRVKVDTLDPAGGRVRLSLDLSGTVPEALPLRFAFDRGEPAERVLPVKDGRVSWEATVPDGRPWSPASPCLHTVTVAIDGDRITERFGLRTVATRGRDILLNGEPVRLLGANRHEAHPEFGPVQPAHLMIDDLKWMKELGANFVRGAHYQQNPEFLEYCDETGMLVWNESLAWGLSEEAALRPETVAALVEATGVMARDGVNHPSVVILGFLNECCSDTAAGRGVYEKLYATVRAADDTRLVAHASNRLEKDICFDLADIVAINHYPGWISATGDWLGESRSNVKPEFDRLARFFDSPECRDKPLLVTETGASAFYGVCDRARAQWSMEFQADYFETAVEAILGNDRYAGVALWQLFDCRSYVRVGDVRSRSRGFNCAGLLDEYRRPKLAFDAVKHLFIRYGMVERALTRKESGHEKSIHVG